MNKDNQTISDSYEFLYNFDEAKHYFSVMGIMLLISFVGLLYLNLFNIASYTTGILGFLLIGLNYTSTSKNNLTQVLLYLIILSVSTVIFICIFQNNFIWNWAYVSSLICFFVIVSFLNWIVFLGMIFLSFSASLLLSYYLYQDYTFNPIIDNIDFIIKSLFPLVCIIILWRHKNILEKIKTKLLYEISTSSLDFSRESNIKISELESALLSKTDFLNSMSHEIRTPIQGFTTLSEGLVLHWKDFSEEKRFDLASQVSNNAKRLASLVTNLLDFSKFTADKMIMDFQSYHLNTAVEDIIDECKELYLSKKKIEFDFKPAKNDTVRADKHRIDQVLRNLFINAIKFSADHSTIKLTVENTRYDNLESLKFSIADTGPGIPENEIESIFDPFVQSSRTRKKGGTGLGLSISKKIIDAHNGHIWAENLNETGAIFYFVIPMTQVKEENFSNEKSSINILMVDDEEICLSSMELLLTNTPYKLIKVMCGLDAIDYLNKDYQSVDIILLDLMMPDIYGLSILQTIKNDPKLAHIPVILQSGTSDKSEIQKAYALGIFSYISKPYKRNLILAEIDKAIEYYSQINS